MNPPHADRPIDLAATPPFRLGGLGITPATRQVRGDDGAEHTAEPRVLQVLIALAEADGAVVSRDGLVQRCWDGRFIGEDAIHRAIAKARRLADLTAPPAFAIESIPRVGYRLRTDPAEAGEARPASAPVDRRVLIAGGVAAVAAAGGAGAWLWNRSRPRPDPLVAVLPFDNLSVDPQLGYFADGLSEDILNALIRGGGVRVTSRTSSFTFRGAGKAKAAAVLKAEYLLDGSVLREGTRLRVNAHLTQVSNQQTLWSQTYDRDLGEGLQIEDEVAAKVASALKVRFAANGPAAALIDPVAFDLYLKGREATRNHTPESLRQGNELLLSAVAKAPRFAPAWFELAKNEWRQGFLESLPQQRRGFALGRQAARRAIELDPRNGAAYGVITQMTPAYRHWFEIGEGLARGLRISPNDPNLLLWEAIFLCRTGRLQASVKAARRAQSLDPLELFANHALCMQLTSASLFREAEAVAARLEAIWPTQIAAYWDRFWLLFAAGRDAEALAMLHDAARRPSGESTEYVVLSQALKAHMSGSDPERRRAGVGLITLARTGSGYASNSIVLLSSLGLFDEAVQVARGLYLNEGPIRINQAVQFLGASRFAPHGEADPSFLFHQFVRPLRKSGRLDEVFDGIGLTDLWRKSGGPDR